MKNIRLIMVLVLVAFGASLALPSDSFSEEAKGSAVQVSSSMKATAEVKAKKGFFESIAESIKTFIDDIASVPSKIKSAMKDIGAEDQQATQRISEVEMKTAALDESEFPQDVGAEVEPKIEVEEKGEVEAVEVVAEKNLGTEAKVVEDEKVNPVAVKAVLPRGVQSQISVVVPSSQPVKAETSGKDYLGLENVAKSEGFAQTIPVTVVASKDDLDGDTAQPVEQAGTESASESEAVVATGESTEASSPVASEADGGAVVASASGESSVGAINIPLPAAQLPLSTRLNTTNTQILSGTLRDRTSLVETPALEVQTRAQVIATTTPVMVPPRISVPVATVVEAPAPTVEAEGLCEDGFAMNDSFEVSVPGGLDNFISVAGKYLLAKGLDGGLNAASICSGHVTRCPVSAAPCVSGLRSVVSTADACMICVASRVEREEMVPQALPSVGEKMIFAFKDKVYVSKDRERFLGDVLVEDVGSGRIDISSIVYKMTPGGVNLCGDCTSGYFLTKKAASGGDAPEMDVTFLLKYEDGSAHPYLSDLVIEGDNPFTYIIALEVRRPTQRQNVFETTRSIDLSNYVRAANPLRELIEAPSRDIMDQRMEIPDFRRDILP